MVSEHKHRRVVRRILAPPSFPGIIVPWTANRPEHIAPEDPGADIFERLNGKPVVHALIPATLSMQFVEYCRAEQPSMQLDAPDPKRIVEVLPRPRPKSIK